MFRIHFTQTSIQATIASSNANDAFVTKERNQYTSLAAHLRAKPNDPLNISKLQKLALHSSSHYDHEIFQFWIDLSPRSDMSRITTKLRGFIQENGLDLNGRIKKLEEVFDEIKTWNAQCHLPTNIVKKLQYQLECKKFALLAEQQLLGLKQQNSDKTMEDTQYYINLKQFIDNIHLLTKQKELHLGEGWKQICTIYQFYHATDPSIEQLSEILGKLRDIAVTRFDDWKNWFAQKGFFQESRPLWLRQLYKQLCNDPNNYNNKSREDNAPTSWISQSELKVKILQITDVNSYQSNSEEVPQLISPNQ